MPDGNTIFEVSRTDIHKTRAIDEPTAELADGHVRLAVERFALTSNNVTYAIFGDMLGYWSFYPAAEDGWGRVPAMGYARVVESARDDVATGGLYSGWYPMARTVDIAAVPTGNGLRDDGAHRAEHAPVYRTLVATDRDPFHEPGEEAENRHALLRILFATSFLADDFFAESDYYGASRVIVMSASSKTAVGFAQRASARGVGEVVGLTSARNIEFVRALGYYDRVVTYDDIETLSPDVDSVSIDMAGNGAVLARVHDRLGDRLRYSMIVGKSHAGAEQGDPPSSGPAPELFFAPTQIQKRIEEWGAAGYEERMKQALLEFVAESAKWLGVTRTSGADGAERIWHDTIAGEVPPSIGHIVSI